VTRWIDIEYDEFVIDDDVNEVMEALAVERVVLPTIECCNVNDNGDLGEPDQTVLTGPSASKSCESIQQFLIAKIWAVKKSFLNLFFIS
jgi:hypothetical protein